MSVSARLGTRRILPGAQLQNLAITITTPNAVDLTPGRPPLSLAIVIDRSGSMHGAPIANARAAALSMLRQLDRRDAFSVVAYSSGARIVVPMERATEDNKAAAQAAIETIDDDGGTCISCGLEAGAAELAGSPITGGVRRMLLISDGQANEGIYDRGELAELAARKAADGTSISTVGVGLEFDEATMRHLAEVGRGNYYFVEDTVALSAMFGRELGTLSQTVAAEVRLVVTALPGAEIVDAIGYPMARSNGRAIIPVADLRAGETRKVVLALRVDAPSGGELGIARVVLDWRRVADGQNLTALAVATVDVVSDPAAVAASADPGAMQAIEKALSARALEDAAAAYDRGGISAARQVLERRSQAIRASAPALDPSTVDELEAASRGAMTEFSRAPEKAKKAASVTAHDLAR
jgi:Ca-activated chloride channel family protein